ncbi:LysR substrate-binding domain-containing protein [soil metagenome]
MGPVNRPLDLEWLEDFLVLAESGSFSRAAQARGIAQPAFSRHVKSLEEWAGLVLVDRAQHPAVLTPAGEVVAAAARGTVLALTQARTRAHEAQEQADRSLRFAATHALSLTFFPAWLQKVEQHLQLGAIHMVSDSFQACEDLMLQRRAQFLLGYGHTAVKTRLAEPEFAFARIGDDELVPVCCAGPGGKPLWALDAKPDAPLPLPLLGYSAASGLGQILLAQLPLVSDAARFTPVMTSHHAVLLKTMAMEGRGVAWLPRSLVAAELATGRVVQAAKKGKGWRVPVEVRLYRAAASMSAAAEAVWAAAG